jgi:DNA-binding transcriptional MerR regulator
MGLQIRDDAVVGDHDARIRASDYPIGVESDTVSGSRPEDVMFGIGDFARHGRVSVRMLRHYDAIGLLRPAHVDPVTGHRSYDAAQLSRLNRVVALKELGFTLDEVGTILDELLGVAELRGMLRLRRAELRSRIAADEARLTQVEARLATIEGEDAMPTDDVQVKRLPAVRVAELTGTAASFEPVSITPVIGPLYEELGRRLARAGVRPTGPGIAYYEQDGSGGVVVHAAIPVDADASAGHDFGVVDLPAVEHAATIVHRGSMDDVMPTLQTLARWIDENGYRSAGDNRELYLDCDGPPDQWVTELQEPVTR